jgi:hypothetical protein
MRSWEIGLAALILVLGERLSAFFRRVFGR